MDDVEILVKAKNDTTSRPPSSLTPFIHFMRLRRIESRIKDVNRRTQANSIAIQEFLDELNAWKNEIPREYRDKDKISYHLFVSGTISITFLSLISPDDSLL